MPGDTTESREPLIQSEGLAFDETRFALGVVGMPQTTTAEALQYAQAQATLAVAEELRALREAVNGSAQCVADEIAKLPGLLAIERSDPRG